MTWNIDIKYSFRSKYAGQLRKNLKTNSRRNQVNLREQTYVTILLDTIANIHRIVPLHSSFSRIVDSWQLMSFFRMRTKWKSNEWPLIFFSKNRPSSDISVLILLQYLLNNFWISRILWYYYLRNLVVLNCHCLPSGYRKSGSSQYIFKRFEISLSLSYTFYDIVWMKKWIFFFFVIKYELLTGVCKLLTIHERHNL